MCDRGTPKCGRVNVLGHERMYQATHVLLFSSCIRNTVAIKVPEGVPELFEISMSLIQRG